MPARDLLLAVLGAPPSEGDAAVALGAGIVADSDPGAEWREAELEAARLLRDTGALVGARS